MNKKDLNLGIIGMGYVGLPLASEFAKKRNVIGFDLNKNKVLQILKKKIRFKVTTNMKLLKNCKTIIVAVPTPINKSKNPNLKLLKKACIDIGKNISRDTLVVFESTVYPGCTEEFCMPLISKLSRLKINKDIFFGYSPERINPGDKKHSLLKINKLVSGSNKQTTSRIKNLYEEILRNKVFVTDTIKIAEAAKIIENTQRDINIALINEFAMILNKLKIDTKKVIRAASTKWNFHPFHAGLVGGHCIGVDPYYLTYKSKKVGINPKVILSGRIINDKMGKYVFSQIKKISSKKNIKIKKSKVLILGFAFKENCEDIRNTKVIDIVNSFKIYNSKIDIYDPLVEKSLIYKMYNLRLINNLNKKKYYDIIINAVPHKEIRKLKFKNIRSCGKKNSIFYDVKSIYPSNLTDGRL